ncbi:MAG TPA: ABC transporter substrate-binding protein [Clostridia bacterium]|nr:ABC transporter substrate-binding protein [Clostridia bacterium]
MSNALHCRKAVSLLLALGIILSLLAVPALAEAPVPIVLTQYDGSTVTLDAEPQHICVPSYAVAMTAYALGLNMTSIATSTRPMPEDMLALPDVGSQNSPNFELIKAYDTDLVLSSTRFMETTKSFFDAQGIPSCYVDITLYSDSRRNIEMLGKAFGKTEAMEALLSDMDAREAAVLEKAMGHEGQTIAILFGTGKSFLFNTPDSYIGEMAGMLGLQNIIESSPEAPSSVAFSTEQLVLLDPDIIVRYAHGANWGEVNESFESMFADNAAFANLKAFQTGRVYSLDEDLFTANPGPGAIDALEALAEILFGAE